MADFWRRHYLLRTSRSLLPFCYFNWFLCRVFLRMLWLLCLLLNMLLRIFFSFIMIKFFSIFSYLFKSAIVFLWLLLWLFRINIWIRWSSSSYLIIASCLYLLFFLKIWINICILKIFIRKFNNRIFFLFRLIWRIFFFHIILFFIKWSLSLISSWIWSFFIMIILFLLFLWLSYCTRKLFMIS